MIDNCHPCSVSVDTKNRSTAGEVASAIAIADAAGRGCAVECVSRNDKVAIGTAAISAACELVDSCHSCSIGIDSENKATSEDVTWCNSPTSGPIKVVTRKHEAPADISAVISLELMKDGHLAGHIRWVYCR